jgi:hypothetical protein
VKAIDNCYWPTADNKVLKEDCKPYMGLVQPGRMTLEHGLAWIYWWDGTDVHIVYYEEE